MQPGPLGTDPRSRRLAGLAAAVFATMDAARREAVAAGVDVIDLSIGSPDLPPAPHVVERLRSAAADPRNYVYPLADLPAFREAVAAWYRNRFGVAVDPATEIVGLNGSQDGLAHVALALCDPGDVVLVPDPGYPIYAAGPRLAGCELYPVPLREEDGFLPDIDAIPAEVWRRARFWLLNYPSNPLSATADLAFFNRVVEAAARHGVIVLHDAAYSELAFDGYRPPSFLQAPGAKEVGVEFNSLSKTFNLAGARVAYALGNAAVVRALAEVKGHLDFGIFRPVQEAAIAALTGPQEGVAAMAATYQRRRDVLVAGLRRAGWDVPSPRATMFCWARLPRGAGDDPGRRRGAGGGSPSERFALDLLRRAGVATVPGVGFGARGEGFVRIALVQSEERIAEAVRRIAESGVLAA